MQLKPRHLTKISCEVVLFNRQHFRISSCLAQRIIPGFSGHLLATYTKKLMTDQDKIVFFNQIKSIYLHGKMISVRGCPELPLEVSTYHYCIMKRHQQLFKEAKSYYKKLQKEEWLAKHI